MRLTLRAVLPVAALALALLLPGQADAQLLYMSVGGGVAGPQGDLGDVTDTGFTIRGQAGLNLIGILDGHVQAGYSRFSGKDGFEAADVWHGGVGGRVGLGFFWIGANGLYSFGDAPEDGFGFAPEVGAKLGPIEVVADYLFGDTEWWALRGAFRF